MDFNVYFHWRPSPGEALARIEEALSNVVPTTRNFMTNLVQPLEDKIDQILAETLAYVTDVQANIAAKDAVITEKDAEIAGLMAQAEANEITIVDVIAGVAAATEKADAALVLIPDVVAPVLPE